MPRKTLANLNARFLKLRRRYDALTDSGVSADAAIIEVARAAAALTHDIAGGHNIEVARMVRDAIMTRAGGAQAHGLPGNLAAMVADDAAAHPDLCSCEKCAAEASREEQMREALLGRFGFEESDILGVSFDGISRAVVQIAGNLPPTSLVNIAGVMLNLLNKEAASRGFEIKGEQEESGGITILVTVKA